MKARTVAAAAGLIAMTLPFDALAFGTINGAGQNAEHEHITRNALSAQLGPLTLSVLAGETGALGAVGEPDRLTGPLILKAEAHCDNADHLAIAGYPQSPTEVSQTLTACRTWMVAALDSAVTEAGRLVNAANVVQVGEAALTPACKFDGSADRAKCRVLEHMGVALHAAQDFYSHSNWVDQPAAGGPSVTNPPGLGKSGRAPWLDPRQALGIPSGLITGCFAGVPETAFCRYEYGLKSRIRHDVLNKDTGPITDVDGPTGAGTTTRGAINGNFERAARAAVADTGDKWAYLEARIRATYPGARGDKIVCVLRRDAPAGC
jgi:hypothetical protein